MIIKDLYIDGFGIFRDFTLEGLDRGVNVILGNNEAGKSTLLKFIRYTLFGYPRRHIDRMPPLHGGDHGGRIVARISSGEEVIFDRRGKEEIQVTFQGNRTASQSLWDQLLGHAHKDLYNNIYSFTLDELTGIGSLDESGMQDKIFSIGLGLGKTSIGEIAGEIAERADQIYKRRGRVHRVAEILGEIDQIHEKITEIRKGIPEYERLKEEIDEKDASLVRQRERLEALKNEKDRFEIYNRCYESFILISSADRELETLPAPAGYPEDGPEELRRTEQELQGYNKRITELEEGTGEEAGMDELKRETGNISYNEDLLGEGEKVDYLRKMLEAYRLNVEENGKDRNRLQEMERTVSSGISEISGSWSGEQITGFTDLAVHQDRIREFRDQFDRIDGRKRELEAKADAMLTGRGAANMKYLAILISIFLLSGSGLLFFYRFYVPGAVTLVLAFLTCFTRKYLVSGKSGHPLDTQMEELREREEVLNRTYSDYLKEQLKLTPVITPESALQVVDRIGSLKKEIDEQRRIRDRIEERTPKIEAFEAKVNSLRNKVPATAGEGNVEIAVSTILQEYENSKALHERKRRLEEDLKRKQREYSRIKADREALETGRQELFASIGADDREGFLEKYRKNGRVGELLEEKRSAVRNIEMIAGRHMAEEVIEFLERNEKISIEQKLRELESGISGAEEEISAAREQLGKAKSELERLEGGSELAESLTELETQRHLLRKAYGEWLVNKTALVLLEKVKGQYEQEKQPDLIKSSGAFFKRITSGRYTGIHASMDDRDILVSDARGASKRMEQLSRGTREQLLISLRLGLIREYEKQAEPLPVVIDEVLVNFDPERAKHVTAILQEFGADRQILVFTCHPSTAEQFDHAAAVKVLDETTGI